MNSIAGQNDMALICQQVYMAYRKFKSHVYYDSTSLFLRKELAAFEYKAFRDIKEGSQYAIAFKKAFKRVFDCLGSNYEQTLQDLLSGLSYKLIPKTIDHERPWEEKDRFITNIIQPNKFKVSKCNALIDAPIEIHVLSVLWLMTVGKKLNPIISSSNYAYHLSLYDNDDRKRIDSETEEDTTLSSGLMLFEPYFIGYQQWRDNGIKKAEQGLDDKKDVTILSLDIKRYFYSIKMNIIEEINKWITSRKLEQLNSQEIRLCEILQEVHKRYASILEEASLISRDDSEYSQTHFPLPIGLLSSGFLGNLGLTPFDEFIHQDITPSYYGRYVDDILMVFVGKKLNPFSETHIDKINSPIDDFISKHLIRESKRNGECYMRRVATEETDNGNYSNESDSVSYYICFGNNKLKIQSKKVIMEYFKSSESRAAINKFKKKLEQNRSEFRLLPFESDVNREFDDAAFKLEYSDSINRLRDVRAISEDKYGASKYLAQKIFLSVLPFEYDKNEKRELKKSADQILTYFRGVNTLQMYTLWEKVASYFVINSDVRSLTCFYNQAHEAIDEIYKTCIDSQSGVDNHKETKPHKSQAKTDKNEVEDVRIDMFTEDIKSSLRDYLDISLAMALSLNPGIILRKEKPFNVDNIEDIQSMIKKLRSSFLFRHNYQYLKAYCYTLDREDDWDKPLLGRDILANPVGELKINVAKFMAPSFLHMQDIAVIQNYNSLTVEQKS